MPREVFVAGQVLTAAEMNIVSDQTVMVFDDASARDSAIPSPSEGMVVYLKDTNQVLKYVTAWVAVNTGFTASQTITATDATWSVPTLASPIVKVTVIGGGGGGGGAAADGTQADGGTGGTTTFNAGGAGTVTAAGGAGGFRAVRNVDGKTGSLGFASSNGGGAGLRSDQSLTANDGFGGLISVAYLDMTGISTVNVTIGAGGAQGGTGGQKGGLGGRGEVIVEYVAG